MFFLALLGFYAKIPAVDDIHLFIIICSYYSFIFFILFFFKRVRGRGVVEQKSLKKVLHFITAFIEGCSSYQYLYLVLLMKSQVRPKQTYSTQYMSNEVMQEMQYSFYTY